jgi:hypothetical protein
MMSVQLNTTPSIANFVASKHDAINKILAILHRHFIGSSPDPEGPFSNVPRPQGDSNSVIDCDASAFKNRRYFHLIHDLRYLLLSEGVQQQFRDREDWLMAFIRMLGTFSGIDANVRARGAHVEYESDAWIDAFNFSFSLASVLIGIFYFYCADGRSCRGCNCGSSCRQFDARCSPVSRGTSNNYRNAAPCPRVAKVRRYGSDDCSVRRR